MWIWSSDNIPPSQEISVRRFESAIFEYITVASIPSYSKITLPCRSTRLLMAPTGTSQVVTLALIPFGRPKSETKARAVREADGLQRLRSERDGQSSKGERCDADGSDDLHADSEFQERQTKAQRTGECPSFLQCASATLFPLSCEREHTAAASNRGSITAPLRTQSLMRPVPTIPNLVFFISTLL